MMMRRLEIVTMLNRLSLSLNTLLDCVRQIIFLYLCRITRTDPHYGIRTIFDHQTCPNVTLKKKHLKMRRSVCKLAARSAERSLAYENSASFASASSSSSSKLFASQLPSKQTEGSSQKASRVHDTRASLSALQSRRLSFLSGTWDWCRPSFKEPLCKATFLYTEKIIFSVSRMFSRWVLPYVYVIQP